MRSSLDASPSAEFAQSPLARICKKLVLIGRASDKGAEYTLYLKLEVAPSPTPQTYALLPDHAVRLEHAVVHPLDASGAAPALSETAASAAHHLGIPLSVHHGLDSPPLLPRDGCATPTGRRRSIGSSRRPSQASFAASTAEISVSNFHINLLTPPLALPQTSMSESSASALSSSASSSVPTKRRQKNVCGFIVILHLEVGLAASPPRAPYMVRLPKPYCLNNYLRFAVDDSVSFNSGGIAVEIEPVVLPRSRSQRKALNRLRAAEAEDEDDAITVGPSSDDGEAGEDDDDDDEGTTIQGSFESCDAVTVRWADPTAGDYHSVRGSVIPLAFRAESVDSRVKYSPCSSTREGNGDAAGRLDPSDSFLTFRFEASAKLFGLFFPGLDAEACLPIALDTYHQEGHWQLSDVEASAGLTSWTQQHPESKGPKDKPGVDVASMNVADQTAPSLDPGPVPSQSDRRSSAIEEEDLLNVAPPTGMTDSNIDFSFDSTNAPHRPKARRHSIVSRGTSRAPTPFPSPPVSSSLDTTGITQTKPAAVHSLHVQLNVGQVANAGSELVITLKGKVELRAKHGRLPASTGDDEELAFALPSLRFPTALEHFTRIEPDAEAPPDTAYVVAGFRRSQWAGSDGRTKLEPFPSVDLRQPGHGFDPEANVVTIRAKGQDVDDGKTQERSTAEERPGLPPLGSATTPNPSSSAQDMVTADLSRPGTPAASTGDAWSNEATYTVRPIHQGTGGSSLAIRLQLDWPSIRGGLLPQASIEAEHMASEDMQVLVAFVNGRQVDVKCSSPGAANSGDDLEWQLDLPSSLADCAGPVKADVLWSLRWDESSQTVASLPRIPWNVMSAAIELSRVGGLHPAVVDPGPLVPSSQLGSGSVQCSGFYLQPRTTLHFEYRPERVEAAPYTHAGLVHSDAEPSFQSSVHGEADAVLPVEVATSMPKQPEAPTHSNRPRKRVNGKAPTSNPAARVSPTWKIALALVSFFAWYSFRALWPRIEDLNEKVGFLAIAQDVDFYDGTYGLVPPLDGSATAWHMRLFEFLAGVNMRQSKYGGFGAGRDEYRLVEETAERDRNSVEEARPQRRQDSPTGSDQATARQDGKPDDRRSSDLASQSETNPIVQLTSSWYSDEIERFVQQRKLEAQKWIEEPSAKQAAAVAGQAASTAPPSAQPRAAKQTPSDVAVSTTEWPGAVMAFLRFVGRPIVRGSLGLFRTVGRVLFG